MKQLLSTSFNGKVTCLSTVNLVRGKNYLQFLEEYYKQIDGTDGHARSSSVCEHTQVMLEKHVIEHYKDHIFLYHKILE